MKRFKDVVVGSYGSPLRFRVVDCGAALAYADYASTVTLHDIATGAVVVSAGACLAGATAGEHDYFFSAPQLDVVRECVGQITLLDGSGLEITSEEFAVRIVRKLAP